MAIKITLDSFLAVMKRSTLLSEELLNSSLEKFRAAKGATTDAKPFAEYLVRQKILTVWQAEKILQGKHKGFFLGRYRLLSLLGKGGMSSVYLAEHMVMKRYCALKVLPAKRVNDASYLGRFHREAQAVAALDHPNIVRAYDVDMTADAGVDIHFLAMEFIRGKSLLELVQLKGPVSVVEAAEFMRQTALGLEHAHKAGLVHRDIKPGNLLVTPTGIIKVLDLGLARFFNDEEASLTVQHDEKVLGTADYISPEQAIDSHKVDRRTDIYSLGCTLYFLLTGHPPFNTGSLAQRLVAHQTKPVPSIILERPDVPAELQAILEKMMEKQVSHRFQTAQEVVDAISIWQRQFTTPVSKALQPTHDTKDPALAARQVLAAKPKSTASQSSTIRHADATAVSSKAPDSEVSLSGHGIQTPGESARDNSSVDGADPLGNFLAELASRHDIDIPTAKGTATSDSQTSRSSSKKLSQAALETAKLRDTPTEVVGSSESAAQASPEIEMWDQVFDPNLLELDGLGAEDLAGSTVPIKSTSPSASSHILGKTTNSARLSWKPTPWRLAAGAAAIMVLAVAGWFYFGRESNPPTITPRIVHPKNLPAADLAVIEVGPQGHFTSINQAIVYVRENFRPLGTQETRTIQVTGGFTYPETISIISGDRNHFPRNVTIKSVGPTAAVIQGNGIQPVLNIEQAESLIIEGFVIDANGAKTGSRIVGYSPLGRLNLLQIKNFTKTGILLEEVAAQTGEEYQINGLTLYSNIKDSVGLRCQAAHGGNTVCVQLANLRIQGPMLSGIEISGPFWKSTLSGSTISDCVVGIRFQGGFLEDVSLMNNTLSHNERGIVFSILPEPESRNLKVLNTLFSGNSQADVVLESGDAAGLADKLLAVPDGRHHNRTDRKVLDLNGIDVFSGDGQLGTMTTFVSKDSTHPDFLKPSTPDLNVASPVGGAKAYVGAVAP